MKRIQIRVLLALFFTFNAVHAQKSKDTKIVDGKVFDRMIVQDITYAISGEGTPVTGIKVDISKPEGTISGMFPINSSRRVAPDLFSFELKGGVTDKSFSLLKGSGNASSAFEFKPSFHYFPALSSALFGRPPQNTLAKTELVNKNRKLKEEKKRILDTIYTVRVLMKHQLEKIGAVELPIAGFSAAPVDQEAIASVLIPKFLNQPGLKFSKGIALSGMLSKLPQAVVGSDGLLVPGTYSEELKIQFDKYEKRLKGLDNEYWDKQITNASEVWTRKDYFWFTISPVLRSDKANEYRTKFEERDSSYFKSGFRWSYGASVNLNKYWVWPKSVAVLARFTYSFLETNNLNNLTPFSYETRTSFFQYGTSVTEKSKAGSAYNNSDVVEGSENQYNFELFVLPLKTFIPGCYLSANASKSRLHKLPTVVGRADDNFKMAIEGGFVFNINSRDKDKTYLSILPYFRYDDITDKIRTSVKTGLEETRKDFQDRNMSIGIKVGIPITLPKNND